jgi:hypothetical protein
MSEEEGKHVPVVPAVSEKKLLPAQDAETCLIESKTLTVKFMETPIHLRVRQMKGSYLIWVGDATVMDHLAVAIKTPFDDQSSVSTVLGDSDMTSAEAMSKRLSLRFKSVVYMSYNLKRLRNDPAVEQLVERTLVQTIKRMEAPVETQTEA